MPNFAGFREPSRLVDTVDVWLSPPGGGDPRLFRLEALNHLDSIAPPFFVRIYEMRFVVEASGQHGPTWIQMPATPGTFGARAAGCPACSRAD